MQNNNASFVGSQGPSSEGSNTSSKTVFFKTTGNEGSSASGTNFGKGGKKGGNKFGRGKGKVPWTREERRVLWECYIRSGKRGCEGYIKRLKDMWDGRDISVRSEASILSQVKCIEAGGLLTELEKVEIESRVRKESEVGGNHADEESESDVDFALERVDQTRVVDKDQVEQTSLEEECKVILTRLDSVVVDGAVRQPTLEENTILSRIREVFKGPDTIEIPSLKSKDRRLVMKEVSLVNSLLHNIARCCDNVTGVNRLLYAGSYVVCERLGVIKKKVELKSKKPWWLRRLDRSLEVWRKDLGRVIEVSRGKRLKQRSVDELERRYQVTVKGTQSVISLLKGKITAASTKIRIYKEANLKKRQNNLFKTNQRQLFKELGGKGNNNNPPPDPDDAKKFWSDIWSQASDFNHEATWLPGVEEEFKGIHQQEDLEILLEDIQVVVKKMTNWKAPGPDGVRGFWFKKFTSVHPVLCRTLNRCLTTGNVPDWMVTSRTVLIQKDPAKGNVASNYRPIACLPLLWKLMTGIFARKAYDHLLHNDLLPDEQKGCRQGTRGTKDQLLIDKAVLHEAKTKHRLLSMAWIDYKKAYDMVPHSWILEMLKLTKVAGNIGRLISASMSKWRTMLSASGQSLGFVDIRRGIFQGDSFSPLLFVLIMVPLTMIMRKEKMGYVFSPYNLKINHLLFMDDLKIYANSQRQLEQLIEVVFKFSRDINMEFGIEKCAILNVNAEGKVSTEGIELPDGRTMKDVGGEGYRYLGILQDREVKMKEMKKLVSNEYLSRLKNVARSKLYSRNLFSAINSLAVSVIRYSAGILDWTNEELASLDVKTRKILAMNGVHHKKGNVDRLYVKRKAGGRGLISVAECVKVEKMNLYYYVDMASELLLHCVGEVVEGVRGCESGTDLKRRLADERIRRIIGMKTHGRYFRENNGIADDRSWYWVSHSYVTKNTEGFVFAAQENAIKTKYMRAKILGEGTDASCRVCQKDLETVGHLVSGCGVLAQREYKRRHDRMGLKIYWELCRYHGIKHSDRWYKEAPDQVRSSKDGKVEIWWDRPVETTKRLDHNRPDVVVVDHANKHWTIIDFSVPNDKNIVTKENEKVEHYRELGYEIRKIHKVTTTTVPIVVGALGAVSKNLNKFLKDLGLGHTFGTIQTTAVLGTSIILRKVLSQPL